jgi:hypothetical protein
VNQLIYSNNIHTIAEGNAYLSTYTNSTPFCPEIAVNTYSRNVGNKAHFHTIQPPKQQNHHRLYRASDGSKHHLLVLSVLSRYEFEGTEENHENPERILNTPSKTETFHIPVTSADCYNYTNLSASFENTIPDVTVHCDKHVRRG